MTFTHGYAANGDLRMYYEVHGHPRAGEPPLLLIPGGGSSIETNFAGLIPALLAESLQVIAVEEEGHGRTAATARPLTAEGSAEDIKAVLDELNVDSVDVLGFSAGGHTALALAMGHPCLRAVPDCRLHLRQPRRCGDRILGGDGKGNPR